MYLRGLSDSAAARPMNSVPAKATLQCRRHSLSVVANNFPNTYSAALSSWWVGPAAKGAHEGDLDFALGFVFSAVSYAGTRTVKLRMFER